MSARRASAATHTRAHSTWAAVSALRHNLGPIEGARPQKPRVCIRLLYLCRTHTDTHSRWFIARLVFASASVIATCAVHVCMIRVRIERLRHSSRETHTAVVGRCVATNGKNTALLAICTSNRIRNEPLRRGAMRKRRGCDAVQYLVAHFCMELG